MRVRVNARMYVPVCVRVYVCALPPARLLSHPHEEKIRLHRISRQTKNQLFNFPAHDVNYLCPQLLVQVVMIYGKNT